MLTVLKCWALVTMVIDHAGIFSGCPGDHWTRYVGRLALPLFAVLVGARWSVHHAPNKFVAAAQCRVRELLERLLIWTAITDVAFLLAGFSGNVLLGLALGPVLALPWRREWCSGGALQVTSWRWAWASWVALPVVWLHGGIYEVSAALMVFGAAVRMPVVVVAFAGIANYQAEVGQIFVAQLGAALGYVGAISGRDLWRKLRVPAWMNHIGFYPGHVAFLALCSWVGRVF